VRGADGQLVVLPVGRRRAPIGAGVRHAGRLLALVASCLLVLLQVAPADGQMRSVFWGAQTRADNSHFTVRIGRPLAFTLAASTSSSEAITIDPVSGLPPGATVDTYADKTESRAVFRWRPHALGDYTLRFVATVGGESTPPRTYVVHVTPNVGYPHSERLPDAHVTHWAKVVQPTVVRSAPRPTAPAVTTIGTLTGDDTENLVVVLARTDVKPGTAWYRIRLAILPNNSTGWVSEQALGHLVRVRTHLYVDRKAFRMTLERNGTVVFRATVGVGRSYWPTPRGEFYIREKLTRFGSPFYGPIAFGTSARSPILTDWPGGGVVGIHGTNQPELLPGRVSHGCIRMRNADIVELARLMPVGTPLTIR
jgi:lipoprotein-anchoring transpeptidase ErfK/SrfK